MSMPVARPRPLLTVRVALLAPALLAATGWLAGCSAPAERAPTLLAVARWQDQRLADADSLARFMTARDAHVRLAAVRAAGQIGRDDALPDLVRALDDRSAVVREAAATALGFLGNAAGAPPLAGVLAGRERTLRLAAIEALGRVPSGGTALLEPARRAAAREAAAAWDGLRDRAAELPADSLLAALRDGLERDERPVLWRVLRCAEKAPADSALTALIAPRAKARDPQLRVHALRALGAQGSRAALAAILASGDEHLTLSGADRGRVKVAHLRALARCGRTVLDGDGPGDVDPDFGRLCTQLTDGSRDRDPHVVRTACEAMTALAEGIELPPEAAQRESLLPVWRLRLARAARARLADPEPPLLAAGVLAWGVLRGGAADRELAPLATMSSTDSPQVAAAAARALGLGGGPDALAPLLAAAQPARPPLVREAALEALGTLAGRHGGETALRRESGAQLVKAARDRDFAVAATAAEQLGRLPTPAGLATLCALLDAPRDDREGAVDIRLGALSAVETVGQAGALPDSLRPRLAAALTRAFDHADVRVRLQARAAARAGKLLPDALVPSEASLRATVPSCARDPRQAPLVLPFAAPRLRCVTARGEFVIALDGRRAPNTVATLLRLVEQDFYRDLTFHRVVPDFVVQGGDPRGDGWGGPGFSLRAERSRVPYERGTVGIADSGLDTGGSQFFVCLSPQPHLNGRYTVVGRVVSGMHVVDAVQPGDRFRLELAR